MKREYNYQQAFDIREIAVRKKILYILAMGFASWFVPFVVSFAFVGKNGVFLLPIPLFKSIMVVVSGGFGAWLLTRAFRAVRPSLRSGLVIGACWLAVNLALDVVFLIPIMGVSIPVYLYDIGLRYLLIPIMATAMGLVAERELGVRGRA